MSRPKRYLEMTDLERDHFEADARYFFEQMQKRLSRLRPTGEHYKILGALSQQVNETVQTVTGKAPGWTRR